MRHTPSLKRRGYVREAKRLFVILAEGKNTEPAYFEAIKRKYNNALIAFDIIGGVGTPLTIAQAAVERAKALKRKRRSGDSFAEADEVWAVFDIDEHPYIPEAIQLCNAHGVNIAQSNPCFEVWLILHIKDYDRPDHRHATQAQLKAWHTAYDHKNRKLPNCNELIIAVEDAELRAQKQCQRRAEERQPLGSPSTTVWKLTQAVRNASDKAK